MPKFDIVTVGSAVSDVFVRTPHQLANVITRNGHQDFCYHVGSKILIDDIHFETGGGGTNTAIAFARLGFKTGYVGKLGNDHNSEFLLDILQKEHVQFLGSRGKGLMGFSVIFVALQHDRTILTYKGVNNDLHWNDIDPQALKTDRFYFSSMLEKSWETACRVAQYATKNNIPYSFNPSQYLADKGVKHLAPMLKGCKLLTLNKEEAETLTGSLSGRPINDLLLKLSKLVPLSVITDGPRGAYAYDGKTKYTIIPRPVNVVETTGAGDAFASGMTAGLHWGMDIDDAMKIGLSEAESVIQHIGAKNILLSKREAIQALRTRYRITKQII